MKASIVIPTYNNRARLELCFKALQDQTIGRENYEIIVVDNESTDGAYELSKEYADQVLIQSEFKSPYPSRNMGIKASKGEYVCLLDSTIVVPEDFLFRAIAGLELLQADFGVPNILFEITNKSTIWEKLDSLVFVNLDRALRNNACPGGAVITSPHFFERFGYFNPNVRSNGDTVWSQKAVKKGAQLVFIRDLTVYYPPKDKKDLLKKARRVGRGNRQVLLNVKGFSKWKIFTSTLSFFVPSSIRSIKQLINERGYEGIEYPLIKTWWANYCLKINQGLARLGF